ncbi:fungal-specific transcription factor domain-containing protein [Thelonectria olida]|uniref:Fungal-specific transcription factor domain-containing protein n=1 Tax=Thelonectria olida TaxID=1576542 RepID=A0A9P8W984_9HYPO|nr:fungal-specific transcription factor domain-containing protein [Thelonectria olida]
MPCGTTTHLTVSQEFNSFLTAFLPMAMESAALLDVLLALAIGHMSLTDASHKVAALETRSTAISNLAAAIRVPSDQVAYHETNAAACLAFVIYEASVSDYRDWYTHFKGTQNLIMSTSARAGGKVFNGPEASKTTTEGQWILRNFAYHDIIGSVTLRKKPLINEDYLDGITDVVDSCLGVATDLLRIETALQDRATDEKLRVRRQNIRDGYKQLEQDLLHWHCHADADSRLAALAYAYRNAALIVLYRLLAERHREQDNIDTVRTRLRLMAKKGQYLWDLRKTPHGANADWTQILDASGEELFAYPNALRL